MQQGVAEVAVRKCVRAAFEPDNNGVQFAESANAWMVNVIVDDFRGIEKTDGSVGSVAEGDQIPGRVEASQGLLLLCGRVVLLSGPFHARKGLFGSLRSHIFDQVGDKELAGDEEVEEEAVEDVLPAVVVAANADEDAILHVSAKSK